MLDFRGYFRLLRTMPGDVRVIHELLAREAGLVQRQLDLAERQYDIVEREIPGLKAELSRLVEILQLVYDEEPETRRRLYALRETPEYELAFTESEPLVSVVIPTFDQYETLGDHAIPSALAQTYSNIEVVVVGDCAPDETGEVIGRFEDSRLSYYNLNRRGPYPADGFKRWLVSGTVAFNEAVRRARGRWIAPLDDDDAFRPHHVERLLEAARAERWEVALSLQEAHLPNGKSQILGEFPPRLSQFNWQGAIYHAGLRFIELELADSLFERPNDWSLCRRWLRVGVRMGMIDEITVDLYPSWGWRDGEGTRKAWSWRGGLRESF